MEAKEAVIPTGSLWKQGPVQSQAVTTALLEKLAMPELAEGELGPTGIALVKLAMNYDVSSPPNGAVFWSGGADFAGKAAAQLAQQQSGAGQPSTTLEGTQGGSLLGSTSAGIGANAKAGKPNGAPWTEQQMAWRVISQRYARGASGDVTAVVGSVPVGESAILREEVKMLRANKNVTSINFLAIKKDAAGNAVTDAKGNFVLVPVSAEEALAMPPPVEKK